MDRDLYFVYFIVLFVILSMGDVLWCACTNAREQWKLPRCPIFELIWNCTCYAGWRGAEFAQLAILESAAIAVMLCRG